MSIFKSFDKDSYGGSVNCKIISLSFCFKPVDVCSKGFFVFFCISLKWDMEVWISELQVFNHYKSFISSQEWPDMTASVIEVHAKPFDLAWASLLLLSAVRSATISVSPSQSSRCVVSCPLNTGISGSKEYVRLVCFLSRTQHVHVMSYHLSKGFSGCWWMKHYTEFLQFTFYVVQGLCGLSFSSLNSLM